MLTLERIAYTFKDEHVVWKYLITKRHIVALMLASNMASRVCVKYTTQSVLNATQEDNFLISALKRVFCMCHSVEVKLESCVHLWARL